MALKMRSLPNSDFQIFPLNPAVLQTNVMSNKNGWFMVPLVNEVTQALVIPIQAMGTSQHIPANEDILTREKEQHVSLPPTINQL